MNTRDARTKSLEAALKEIQDPASGRDILSAGCVKNLSHCDGAVKVALEIAAAAPERETLRQHTLETLQALDWVGEVKIEAAPPAPGEAAGPESDLCAIVAVASGKGGVGKSTVAANLAVGLCRSGRRVGLLDADLYGPSIPTMLGVTGQPEVIEKNGKQLLRPLTAHGVKLMSIGFLVAEDQPLIWRGPMLHGALNQFFNDVDWGRLDVLVIDLPPGTGDVALSMAQSMHLTGALIVCTPQAVARLDAKKALAMFKKTDVPILGVVENMSGEIFGRGGCEAWAKAEKLSFLGSIPLDAAIRKSGDEGCPALLDLSSAAGQALEEMAKLVADAILAQQKKTPPRPSISIRR